jgi:hypothetical protein
VKRNILASFAALLTGILIFGSCNKIDTTDLGNELIPGSDNVETIDTTLDVITDNLLTPSTDTIKMPYSELHTAGVIENDAEFGTTEAHFYSSFVTSQSHSYPFVNRDTVRIDSVVLSLAYSQLYGDSGSIQNFEVREIFTGYQFKDTGYQIDNPDLPVRPEVLGNKSVLFYTLNDSLSYVNDKDTVRTSSELRIHLDTAWARRFVSYDTTAGSAYNNDSTFMDVFRGFEVRVNEGASPLKKALAYFDLTDNSKTRITFYCRIQNNGRTDTIAPYFLYKAGAPQANMVRRTPANAYQANVNNGLPSDEKVYLQTTPGSFAKIEIPGLASLDNRVIHRAELICERFNSQEDNVYPPPQYMFIEAFSQTGDSILTIRNDFILANTARGYDINTLGGLFQNNRQYVFNLTRYVQSIVTKKQTSYTLRISAPFTSSPYFVSTNDQVASKLPFSLVLNPTLAGGRVVLYGGSHPDTTKKMRLRIIYSKI